MQEDHFALILHVDRNTGGVFAHFYQEDQLGLTEEIGRCEFGPFDTGQDILLWAVRKFVAAAKLPMR